MEKVRFTTKIETKDMFRFQVYHTYHSASGIVLLMLCVWALADLIMNFAAIGLGAKLLCILLLAMALVINPITSYFKAKSQVAESELYQKPMEMEFSSEGMRIMQGEKDVLLGWENIYKIVIQKHTVIIYLGRVRAHLISLDNLSEPADKVIGTIVKNARKVRIIGGWKYRRK